MSNPMQTVKLGQSLFQDTFFVANSQLTPFRKLRQIELELNQLESSIFKTELNLKRQNIKMKELNLKLSKPQSELNENKELLEIDKEELYFDMQNTWRLLQDAKDRVENFTLLKKQLIESVPQEYWDQGFEQAEFDNWTKHFAKQLQISILTGVPNPHLIEQISQLPEQMVKQIMISGKDQAKQFLLLDQSTTEND